MVARRSFSSAAAPTTLSADITNAAVSFAVADGSTYVDGTSGSSVLTINRGKSNEERILYTTRIGNTFSGLTRGYNGTAAQSHTAGEPIEHTSTQQDFDEANAHLADATLDHHTQYLRTDGTREMLRDVADLLILHRPNSTADNVVGVDFAHNNASSARSVNAAIYGRMVSGVVGAESGSIQFFCRNSGTLAKVAELGQTGGITAVGADHYFGANAFGGAGTRIHLGSLGDPSNALVLAEGSGADVGLVLKSKGAGAVLLSNAGGSDSLGIESDGKIRTTQALTYLVSTVGAAGGASALPATPVGYMIVSINGTDRKIAYWNV